MPKAQKAPLAKKAARKNPENYEAEARRELSELERLVFKKLIPEIKRLRKLVAYDALTGALNRRGILDEFGILFREAAYAGARGDHQRNYDIPDLSLLFIDCDHFKKINDTYGHETGDKVLKGVATALKENVRSVDLVGRWGGEEFVVALFGAGEKDACRKAEQIRRKLPEAVAWKKHPKLRVTASVGVASLRGTGVTALKQLIDCADKAMYEAKHNRGRDTTVCWSELAARPFAALFSGAPAPAQKPAAPAARKKRG